MTRARSIFAFWPGVAFIIAALTLHEFLTREGFVRRAFLPAPSDIWQTLVEIITSGQFAGPLLFTLGLFIAGFLISSVVGVALGLLMGSSQFFSDLFEPLVEGIRPIPKVALIPMLILFFGIGAEMKIAAAVLASFFPVLINTIQGVRGVDPVLINTGRTFGYSRAQILFKIQLPAAIPYITAGMRVGLGIALLATVVAEMLAGTGGLGSTILDHQRAFRIRDMYGWVVVLAVVGLALNTLMTVVERRLVPWLEKYRPN